MTIEELEMILEEGGAELAKSLISVVDPEEDTSRATAIVNLMFSAASRYNNLATAVKGQSPAAIISRILVGALDAVDDKYLPLVVEENPDT